VNDEACLLRPRLQSKRLRTQPVLSTILRYRKSRGFTLISLMCR
jgi:hypothetical protein